MDSRMEIVHGAEIGDDSGEINDDSNESRENVSSSDFEIDDFVMYFEDEGTTFENEKLRKIANCLLHENRQEQRQFEAKSFCVQDALIADDIEVEVQDIGKLTFPIDQESVEKLIKISTKAKFGLLEKTIFDKSVRDTREISAEKLKVTIKEQSFTLMLDRVKKKLGISEKSYLVPHLHNMLIYGPNQFFAKHQDTEKFQNMVATIVIVLPSPHIGGNLLIQHGKKLHTFRSENIFSTNAKCIAFYADCMHEIQKVREGHRITLTYNLVLKSAEGNFTTENQALKEAVEDYFTTDSKLCKMIYFLNHSYTKQGLKWLLLKGEDRVNASALNCVAKELNLVFHLALVDINETWSTDQNFLYSSSPDIEECQYININLSNWIDINDKNISFKYYTPKEDEICWTKDTRFLKPFQKDYEGYQGNYGGNMDIWYKRAAIILWPQSRHILMTFELNCDDAIKDLYKLTTEPGNEKKIIEAIEQAENNLYRNAEDTECAIINLLQIALYIKNADKAKLILSHFEWIELNPDSAEIFVKFHIQYSIDWLIDLFQTWKKISSGEDYSIVVDKIEKFQKIFLDLTGDPKAVEPLRLTIEVIHILQKFDINYDMGMNDIIALTKKPGNEHKVVKILELEDGDLYQQSNGNKIGVIENLLNIALYIKDANLAQNILSHFEWDVLIPSNAGLIVKLQIQYGSSWLNTILHKWRNEGKLKNTILAKFNVFVNSFLNAKGDAQIVATLLKIQRAAIVHYNKLRMMFRSIDLMETSSTRIKLIGQLLQSCAKIKNVSELNKIIGYAMSNPELYDVFSLCELYLNLNKDISSDLFLHFNSLKAYLIKCITEQLPTAKHNENDWSINVTLSCYCELCGEVKNFLQSATDKMLAWPLARKKRLHVIKTLNGLNLPLDLTVERKGSPHKLILVKNKSLIIDAPQKMFDKCTDCLQRLRAVSDD